MGAGTCGVKGSRGARRGERLCLQVLLGSGQESELLDWLRFHRTWTTPRSKPVTTPRQRRDAPPPARPAMRPGASLPAPAQGGGLLLGRPARPLVTRSSLDVPAVLRPSARAGVTRLGLPLCGPGRRLGLSVPLRFPGRGCWTGAAGHQSPSGALGDGSVPDIPLMSVYNSARPPSFLGNSVEERNLKKNLPESLASPPPAGLGFLGPGRRPPGPWSGSVSATERGSPHFTAERGPRDPSRCRAAQKRGPRPWASGLVTSHLSTRPGTR